MTLVARRFGRTLRARLTLGLVGVLLLACIVIGIATTLFLRGFLLGRLDSQLTAAGGRFAISLEHGDLAPGGSDGDEDNVVPGQSVGTLGVRLAGGSVAQAAVVGADGRNRTPSLSARDDAALGSLPVGGGGRSVDLSALGDYRMRAVAGRDNDVQITGLPLRDVDQTVTRLMTIELILFGVVVAASAALAAYLVRRTTRPLRQVAETALHVSELPLTETATRLPSGVAPERPESEVDQVSVAFDRMLAHVQESLGIRDATEQRLRRFVGDASHELRTPLAAIRAHTEYALRDSAELPDRTVIALNRVEDAALRMAALVDDLLLLARLDAGRPLAREPVDLTRLVLDAVADARAAAPDHRWRLDLPEEPVEVVGDGTRLHQILANLLGNAGTHTPAGTTVTVGLAAAVDGIDLDVTDDGPGIPADLKTDLFDRFVRGDPARAAGHGSSGLGLAIARGIATAHKGTLTADSDAGATRFRLHLPTG